MFASKPKEQSPSPTEAAKNEVVRLFQIERDLTARRREKVLAVEAVHKNASQEILDGGSIDTAAARVVQVEAEVRAIEQAIVLARQRRAGLIKQRYAVEASESRTAAQTARKEAVEIRKRCEPLLAKLSLIEGVQYDTSILLAQRNDRWHDSLITGTPVAECNPLEAMADIGAGFLVPRSQALLNEAKDLEQKANALDEREVHATYAFTKATLDDILASDEFQNPEALTPAVFVIEKWAAAIEERIMRERPDLLTTGEKIATGGMIAGYTVSDTFTPRRRQWRIAWRDGALDADNSSLTFLNTGVIFNDATFTAEVPA